MKGAPGTAPTGLIVGFLAATVVLKVVAALTTGFGDDEAYTLVIARRLALSYFDHPPLHQWLLHGFVWLAGEGRWDRLPFLALAVATNLPLFGIARRLFGRDAALWTLVAFNASAYFLTLPDGIITPDAPMLPALAAAVWAIVEILYAPASSRFRDTALWLAAGVAFGLAGLSKYAAVLTPLGLAGFLVFSPRHRHWFADPRPYAAAVLAIALFSPALIWNAGHGWTSLAFQTGRAQGGPRFDTEGVIGLLQTIAGQIVSVSPWIFVALSAGLWRAARHCGPNDGARLLLWVAAPPLLLFAALPFVGQRAIPHWFNSGWLFAFPLAGAWFAALAARAQMRWASACVALSAITLALYYPAVAMGPAALLPSGLPKFHDPTAFSYDWRSAAASDAWNSDGGPPDFVLVDNWRVGGRIGAALGPTAPICGFGDDPRGLAFACDCSGLLGRDALLVAPEADAARTFAAAAPYFEHIETPELFTVGRSGLAERRLLIARAVRLVAPYPASYGPVATLSRR
jgi:Dolichyl-phosphate-mannose-protein mannosyltransferase